MNWRTYNSLRMTEGYCPGLPAVPHLTSSLALSLRPWVQFPYPRKDSRWRTGLYFYNIKAGSTKHCADHWSGSLGDGHLHCGACPLLHLRVLGTREGS